MTVTDSNQTLYCFMDETDAPFEEGKNPFLRTKEEDDFDKKIIKEYNLELRRSPEKI